MAEEQKTQQEVELDTDGVNEEIINVDKPAEPDEAFSKKENVDLGYTNPIPENKEQEEPEEKKEEPKTEVEVKEKEEKKEVETKPANLKEKQTNYQKRINELVFQAKEAERREKAALNYAKGLKKRNQEVEEKLNKTDDNYLKEVQARVTSEQDKLKQNLKEALDAQDSEKVAEINTQLTQLAIQNEKAKIMLEEKEAQKKNTEKPSQEDPIPGEKPVNISKKAQDWASENKWFGTDEIMTGAAMAIDSQLRAQGIETDSDEYYNNVNKRMREYFPQKFAQDSTDKEPVATKQPVQNVAGVSRKQGGRKSVKLTKSQVVIAKKLGVPLEEYAKFVKGGN